MALTRRALLGCCTLAIPLLATAPVAREHRSHGPTIEPASLRLRGDAVAWIDAAGSHTAPVPG